MGHRVSLADIARRTGVSVAAVSLALRDAGRMAPATRAKIREAAASMGYQPNPLIAALASKRFGTEGRPGIPLAYIQSPEPNAEEELTSKVLFGHLKEHAQKLGYFLQHFNVDEFQDGRHATQVLFSRGVQGIIVSSSFESKMLPDMDWPRFFVVGLGGRIIETPNFRGEPFYRTAVDHFGLTVHAWNKTWEKGYRRIGFALFGLNRGWVDDELRWAAAQICLQRLPAGDRIPPLLIETNKKERSDHNQEMRKWIERHRPEVVIGFNSFVGHIVRWAGFRIPQDVAFVNLHKATSFEHEIAGQDNDTGMREMRRECLLSTVELLDQQIRHHQYGSGTQPRTVMIHSEWIEGDTLPLKSSDKPAQARSL